MRTPGQWLRRMRRRRPGVYVYRTDRHDNPRRREWGYAGESWDLRVRKLCHLGQCHHTSGCDAKPWSDLRPRRYTVIRLPFWLAPKWVLHRIEDVVILVLRPRYNWAHNPRPDKVGPREQKIQRAIRDARPPAERMAIARGHFADAALKVMGALVILTGLIGWMVTR